MRFNLLFNLCTLLLCACPPNPPVTPPTDASDAQPPPQPPVPLSDAAPLTLDCSGACTVLRSYGCPEGFGVDGGDSCEVTCTRAQGPYDMHAPCIVKAGSLQAIRVCGTVIKCTGVNGVRSP